VPIKEMLRETQGIKIIVADKKHRSAYYVNAKNSYNRVLLDLQSKLIKLDVLESEPQQLTAIFDTDKADRLINDVFEIANIVRCKLIKI
jgi:hypothetical protein